MPFQREYFIELASELYVPLRRLWFTPESYCPQWNRPWHGLSSRELAEGLLQLHAEGLIQLEDFLPDDESVPASVSLPALQAAIETPRSNPSEGLAYGLTSLGGTLFESAYDANWSRYYVMDWQDDDRIRLQFSDLSRRDSLIEFVEAMEQRELKCLDIQFREPWQATYWKTLPSCWELEATYTQRRVNCEDYFRIEAQKQSSEFFGYYWRSQFPWGAKDC